MLTGTCLRNYTGLTHLLCQQYLTQYVIDFMGTRMIQVLSFQINLRTAQILCHMFCKIQSRRSSRILIQKFRQFPVKLRVIFIKVISLFQFDHCIHQCLRNILASVNTKSSF